MPSCRVVLEPLLEQIHDAALGTLPWETALSSVTKLFRVNSAVIAVELKHGGGWGVSTGVDARIHADYFEHYAGIHPLAARASAAPVGSVLTDRMLMPKAEFQHTEFYADWARRSQFDEMLNVRLASSERGVVGMGLTRSSRAGEFEAADFALVRRLAPHLRRAIATYQQLEGVLSSRQGMAEALDYMRRGVFGLDLTGRIVFANQAARLLLAAGDVLRADGGLLAANRPDRTTVLQRMVRSAALGGVTRVLALPRPNGGLPLMLETVPMGSSVAPLGLRPPPAVLLLIDDPENDGAPTAAALREHYGLTTTEAAMAIHAARGAGLGAVAQVLGIAPSTARSHLKRVFDKTGTHRQAELAWLLARLSGQGPPPRKSTESGVVQNSPFLGYTRRAETTGL